MSIFKNKELLEKIVKESKTKKEILYKLGYTTLAGNYRTLNRYVKKYKIDTSHLHSIAGFYTGHKLSKKWENNQIFINNPSHKLSNENLKNRLYKSNTKKKECELCGINEDWNGSKLTLILDHIDGIKTNNELSNLRIICPNCDSTLPTYMGRNNKTHEIRVREKNRKKEQKLLEKQFDKQIKLNNLKEHLINSGIDFSKKTWGVEVSIILGKSPQYSLKYIKENLPELLTKV